MALRPVPQPASPESTWYSLPGASVGTACAGHPPGGCAACLSSTLMTALLQVPTAHPGRGRELPFHPQAPCSEPTNRTAASLPGDGPGESSSFSVLPEPKRSWAGTCPGCSQPMPVDDSGDFSSLDTLLWQKTECLLQTFLKNNFCQGWEIWTLSHQR